MGYKQTERLKKSLNVQKTGIGNSSSAWGDISRSKKAGMGVKSIADFGLQVIGGVQKFKAATADQTSAWDQYEQGREAVGLDRTDTELDFFERLGRRFKGPDVSEKYDVNTQRVDDAGVGFQDTHTYTTGELKRIGTEVMAGTDKSTLGDKQWKDVLGTSGKQNERITPDWDAINTDRLKNIQTEKARVEKLGIKSKDSMGSNVGNTLESSTSTTDDTSPTENTPTDNMDKSWKSQFGGLDEAIRYRSDNPNEWTESMQSEVNLAYKLGPEMEEPLFGYEGAKKVWGSDLFNQGGMGIYK
tara:strand:- start:1841 stop:2740 length:900 start_codon:yes stop_codon:yes gene_type:complete